MPAGKLVHDINGTFAAVSLHLRLIPAAQLPPLSREHLQAALRGLELARDQLIQLAEVLRDLGPARRQTRSVRK